MSYSLSKENLDKLNQDIHFDILEKILQPFMAKLNTYDQTTPLWMYNYCKDIVEDRINTDNEVKRMFSLLLTDLSIYLFDYRNYDHNENNTLNSIFGLLDSGLPESKVWLEKGRIKELLKESV